MTKISFLYRNQNKGKHTVNNKNIVNHNKAIYLVTKYSYIQRLNNSDLLRDVNVYK